MPEEETRVVYLVGAGASHAVVKYLDETNQGTLMSDITDAVLSSLEKEEDSSLKELCNIPEAETGKKYEGIDIESIITLYEESGTQIDKKRTIKLRQLFSRAVNQRIDRAISHSKDKPHLIDILLDMHSIPGNKEGLQAIITMNYDNLLEKSLMNIYKNINIPFEATSDDYIFGNSSPVFCKLHGSFNWENTNPVRISDKILEEQNEQDGILWIPPGVIKNNIMYPFSAIWANARNCLDCDILRIVGCSLNTNDWSVLSLLHTTNRLRNDKRKYEIQCIDYPEATKIGKKKYPYLNLHSLIDIPSFSNYIMKEYSVDFKDEEGVDDNAKIESWLSSHRNIFELWLESMGYDISVEQGIDLETEKGYFSQFYSRS